VAGGVRRAWASQPYPTRPVRIIVPFTPGGSNDVIARGLAERMHARLGQPFVVENRPGAGSAIGAAAVAQSPPDGYTLLVTSNSVAALAALQRGGFDAARDLEAVALLVRAPFIVLVAPSFPAQTMQDLVRIARERPGEVNYASAGPGSNNHLATELCNLRAGTCMQHVPYHGMASALTDLAAGRVQVLFTTMASASGPMRAGTVRLLAYTAPERPAGMPPAPTVKEATGIDYTLGLWWALFGPRGLPPEVVRTLNAAANDSLADPALAHYLEADGGVPSPATPAEAAALLREESERACELVAAAGIHAN
jgi:tripartite-type tricarboxylate transporter receptor subunit TctC